MKTRNILFAFFTCAFLLGVSTINAQDKIYVHEKNGTAVAYDIADLDSISFTPPAAPIDYTKLVINEVNGVGKWFEIYNQGDTEISLNGVTVYYSNSEPASYKITWTGTIESIPAGGYLQVTSLLTGLSANNANVRLQMRAPDGTILDTYERLIDINSGYDAIKNKSHARIPDGTDNWYYTTDGIGTPGATNGTSTEGCIKFGEEDGVVVIPTEDYSKLVINEVNGVGKWFEIYNMGDTEISLNGVTAFYSNSDPASYKITWTGTAESIPAGGYLQVTSLLTGLSANNANVRLQMRAPDGIILDTYEKLIDINSGYDAIKNKSHARIPDGTGVWYYTSDDTGTPSATNGTSTEGCTKFGEEN